MPKWRPLGFTRPMVSRRNLAMSVLLALGGTVGAYLLAWGLFATHPELGMDSGNAFTIALWTTPLVFLVSLAYFAIRSGKRH